MRGEVIYTPIACFAPSSVRSVALTHKPPFNGLNKIRHVLPVFYRVRCCRSGSDVVIGDLIQHQVVPFEILEKYISLTVK